MVESERRTPPRSLRPQGASKTNPLEELPYSVELRSAHSTRLLARARSIALARAIFDAACKEYPDSDIFLNRGSRTVASRSS